MSLAFLIGVASAMHVYVATRLLGPLAALLPGAAGLAVASAMALLLAVSALCSPLGLLSRRVADPRTAQTLAWIGFVFMGLFSSLFVLTLLRDALLIAVWLVNALAPAALPAQRVRELSAAAVPLLALAVTALGFLNARRTARVVTVEVAITGLPPALEGFTMVQISDIHVGPTIRAAYLDGIVEACNRLDADLVAITGDLVDGSVAELASHVAPLARLKTRHGSFFVTGNHEYYAGAHSWIAELRRLGIQVLLNQHVVIEQGGARMVVAGVTDYTAHHFDPAHGSDPLAALHGAPPAVALRVLLAHQPRSAEAAVKAGFDLQLSGHTHGGQFLPWNFFVRLQQPFTAGLHRLGALQVYVSRGTGYWGPPKRFGAPSEITRLRLVTAPNA